MNFKYHTDLQNPANIIARWLMDLSEYEFEFQNVKGKNNLLADYISREKHGHAEMPSDRILPALINSQTVNALITQELSDEITLAAQDADDDIQKIKSSLQEHKNKEKYFIDHNSGLLMHISFYQNYLKDICRKTIIIPHSRKTALQQAHLPHMGIDKTYFILKERFLGTECTLIPSTMSHLVHLVADTRENHVRNKHTEKHPSQHDRVSLFLSTLLVLSDLTILSSVLDHFSKHAELFPITNIQAPTIARKIIQYITTFVAVHKSFYNGTKHSSYGFTPDVVHFGRNRSLVFDTITAPTEAPLLTEEGYTNTLLSSLQVLQQQIRTNLQTQQDKQHARLNSNTMQRAPKDGDVVYTLSGNQFRPKFDGPFEVIKKPNKYTCITRELDNQQAPELKVNTHKLKLSCRRFDYLKKKNDPNQSEVQTARQGPVLRPR
ncbi:transposon Tf2-9 polyprotein [Trichonephila inaurata madagascariensis]|uniref:Transposon Tf2-9 polyprotein n=1 Tax=Trichonephila inaurata madagascariensis TaxID=2747483 RepID=A0A8X6Y233_9ARAC|nr:transposon Tf2-9 polyprotein [Trichonephila inaurata madagascariensis]